MAAIGLSRTNFVLFVLLIFSWYHIFIGNKIIPKIVPEKLSNLFDASTAAAASTSPAPGFHLVKSSNNAQCLSLDFEDEMDQLLSTHRQVFIGMPAKAAGSSLKNFAVKCMKKDFSKNVLNKRNQIYPMEDMLQQVLEPPSLITSHLYDEYAFQRLIKHATKQTLIIYIHREETSRLLSAIGEISEKLICPLGEFSNRTKTTINDRKDILCTIDEKSLISEIKKRTGEIKFGAPDILTRDTYDSIRDNAPHIVYVHYKQANRLQTLLAKHHCPELLELPPVQKNVQLTKRRVDVKLTKDNAIVELKDWLAAKRDILELALELKDKVSGQATTRTMEETLLACPDETLVFSP